MVDTTKNCPGNFLVQLFYGSTQEWANSAKANKIDILPSISLITHILFWNFVSRHNFSLVARYSLKFTRCSLQNLLVTCCRSYSLQKINHNSLQELLVAKKHLLLGTKFARYMFQKLLVAKSQSLLVAKLTCYLLQKITCYSLLNNFHCKKSFATL